MHTDLLIGTDPHDTYRYSLRVVRKILRGTSVGVQDADDIANDTAMRFWNSDNPDKMKNPRAFITGIARNVYREAIREEIRQRKAYRFAEIPAVPSSGTESLPPLSGEFLDRLLARATKNEHAILRELMFPEGRTRREIAKDLNKSETAFSEAIRRITEKSNVLHGEMVAAALDGLVSTPPLQSQSLLLGLARTPGERMDFRIRIFDVAYKLAFREFTSETASTLSLVAEADRHYDLVRQYRIKAGVKDSLFIAKLRYGFAFQSAFAARSSEDDRDRFFDLLTSAFRFYNNYGFDHEAVCVFTDLVEVIEFLGGPRDHLWTLNRLLPRVNDPDAARRMQAFIERFA